MTVKFDSIAIGATVGVLVLMMIHAGLTQHLRKKDDSPTIGGMKKYSKRRSHKRRNTKTKRH
jgi:hypothetical protein